MTKQDYINAGFRISAQVDDKELQRAESEVIMAYIAKVSTVGILPNGLYVTTPEQGKAIMQLVYILLLQRTAVVTRAGGKTKLSPSLSEAGYPSQSDLENADRLLRAIQTVDGLLSTLVDDICQIYYRNKFIGL